MGNVASCNNCDSKIQEKEFRFEFDCLYYCFNCYHKIRQLIYDFVNKNDLSDDKDLDFFEVN